MAPGHSQDFPVGFRVVQGELLSSEYLNEDIPFARAGVKQSIENVLDVKNHVFDCCVYLKLLGLHVKCFSCKEWIIAVTPVALQLSW